MSFSVLMEHTELNKSISGPNYAETVAGDNPAIAEWIRPPRNRLYGLSRGFWYARVADGHVRTVTLRKKGALRGARLWYGPDVRAYLQRLLDEQNPKKEEVA